MLFVAEKPPPPPPGWGKIIWLLIYPFQVILSKFGFCGRKAPPPGGGKIFWLWIYPFKAILSKFGFCSRKAPPPQDEGNFFDFGSIHFRWFWPPYAFCGRKAPPPPPGWGKFFWLWIYPFQVILRKFGFCGREPPPPPGWGKIFLTLDLSISRWFWASLVFVAEKPPPQEEGKFFDFGSIHLRRFWVNLVFVAEKPPPSFLPFGEILGSCCSTWRNFADWYFMHHWIYPFQVIGDLLCFLWQKSPPPPKMRENFFDFRFIHFRLILRKFGFCGREAIHPQHEGKFFDFGSIYFRQFWASLVFVAEKPPPPGWGKIFWLWIYPFQVILSKFGFCGRKATPPQMRGNFLTLDLSISCDLSNFAFCGRKAPLQDEGKFFDFGSIHFRWFWASLVFVAEKSPPLFSTFWWDTWLVLQHMT